LLSLSPLQATSAAASTSPRTLPIHSSGARL
jgi:hypothetical protein